MMLLMSKKWMSGDGQKMARDHLSECYFHVVLEAKFWSLPGCFILFLNVKQIIKAILKLPAKIYESIFCINNQHQFCCCFGL